VELGAGVQADKAMKYSTLGRNRKLTEVQIREVLEWARNRLSARALAARLGCGTGLIHEIARTGGLHYKKPPPLVPQ
jgi:transposase